MDQVEQRDVCVLVGDDVAAAIFYKLCSDCFFKCVRLPKKEFSFNVLILNIYLCLGHKRIK